jgi:transposase-like protein
MPRRSLPEFRRKVLDPVTSGRRVAQVAADLDISDQTIYAWRRREFVDASDYRVLPAPTMPSWPSPRTAQGEQHPKKTVRGGHGDRLGTAVDPARVPRPRAQHRMAISNRSPLSNTVIHSDHGVQFTLWTFPRRAKDSRLLPSMGSIGDRHDNAMIEADTTAVGMLTPIEYELQ